MSPLADEIGRHLPDLCRYARVAAGSRREGDRQVIIALEQLQRDPRRISPEGDVGLQLFKLLHDTWRVSAADIREGGEDGSVEDDSAGAVSQIRAELRNLSEKELRLLLLVQFEGFSLFEAAAILTIPERDAQTQLAAAYSKAEIKTPARILIIEDEAAVALDIAVALRSVGHIVVGVAPTCGRAVQLARERNPDLILADLLLRHGENGIDAIEKILGRRAVPVIYITGCPERLPDQKDRSAISVLAKPFRPAQLLAAIAQARLHRPAAIWLNQNAS